MFCPYSIICNAFLSIRFIHAFDFVDLFGHSILSWIIFGFKICLGLMGINRCCENGDANVRLRTFHEFMPIMLLGSSNNSNFYLFELSLCLLIEELIELFVNVYWLVFGWRSIIHGVLWFASLLFTCPKISTCSLSIIVAFDSYPNIFIIFSSFEAITKNLISLLYFVKSFLIFTFVDIRMVDFSKSKIILFDVCQRSATRYLQYLIICFFLCTWTGCSRGCCKIIGVFYW